MDFDNVTCIIDEDLYKLHQKYLTQLNVKIRFYPTEISENENVLCVNRLLPMNYREAGFIGLLNLDSTVSWKNYYRDEIFTSRFPIQIFDPNMNRIKFSEEIYGLSSTHLPFSLECLQELTTKFMEMEKIYDVGIIGPVHVRNHSVMRTLIKQNVNLHLITDEDDFFKCKIVLNIYESTNENLFNEYLFERFLNAGVVIISEPSLYDDDHRKYPNYRILPYEKMFNSTNFITSTLKIGVAIPTYIKDLCWLYRCLDSIEKQTRKPDSVVVSASNCKQADLQAYNYSFPLKIVTSEKTQNVAENRNIAANELHEMDIITFIDSDDEMLPNRLSFIERTFIENDVDFVIHGCTLVKSSQEKPVIVHSDYVCYPNVVSPHPMELGIMKPASILGNIHHGAISVTQSLWSKEQFNIDSNHFYLEDSIYARKLCQLGYRSAYLSTELMIYHEYKEKYLDYYLSARDLRYKGRNIESYRLIKMGLPLSPDPEKEFQMYEELSIVAYYNGQIREGAYACDRVVLSQHASQDLIQQTINNSIFHIPKLEIQTTSGEVENGTDDIACIDWTVISWDPLFIKDTKTQNVFVNKRITHYNLKTFKSSSNFIVFSSSGQKGYLCTVFYPLHQNNYHRFVYIDNAFEHIKIGRVFEFELCTKISLKRTRAGVIITYDDKICVVEDIVINDFLNHL